MITWISRDGVVLHEVWSRTSSREVLLHEVWSSRGSIVPYSYTSSPNHNRPRSQPSEPLVIRSTPSTHHTPLNGNQGVRLELFYCLEWSCAVVFCKNGVMWTRKMAAAKLPLCIFSAASFVILICIIDCLSLAFDHDGWTYACHNQLQARDVLKNLWCDPPVFFPSSHFDYFNIRERVQPLQACSPLNNLLLSSFGPFHNRCCVRLLVIVWNQWCRMRSKVICLCWLSDADSCIV